MKIMVYVFPEQKQLIVNRFTPDGLLIEGSGIYDLILKKDDKTYFICDPIDITDCLKEFLKDSIIEEMEHMQLMEQQ